MRALSRFVIIYNPKAGRRRAVRLAERVRQHVREAGAECLTRTTSATGDAEQITNEAVQNHSVRDSLCIVACGGDGTVQEVANAVARAPADRVCLGVAPAGRCNDFARALGIRRRADLIARTLLSGVAKPVDLGRAGERYFCTVAAVGFDAAVSRFVNEMRMPLRGTPAYVYGALRVLWRYRTPRLRVAGGFGEHVGPVFFVATANTPCYGGAMRIAPGADAFDGILDVCMVTQISRLRVVRLIPRVMNGSHVTLPEVRLLRTRSLSVEAAEQNADIEVWADGEPLGRLPARLEVVSGAVRVVVPRRSKTV